MSVAADKEIDSRYAFLRNRHGRINPMANGYRVSGFFAREQRVLLSAIDKENGPFLDVACGSGLMLAPLLNEGYEVFGLDFNADACLAAHDNTLQILRGDAFNMPFSDNMIGQIVNCQFLNQQTSEQTRAFISESARVLKPCGQLIILWRHARSLIHIAAHAVFNLKDKLIGQPPFPHYTHSMVALKIYAREAGLSVEKEAVTLPCFKAEMISSNSLAAHIIGASLFIVLKKKP